MPSPKFVPQVSPATEAVPARQIFDRPPTDMIRESLNSRFDIALSELEARTCHSWKMALDRSKVLATSHNISNRPQIIIRAAEGCRITDIDDNTFIDLTMGYGSNLLGHSPSVVHQALVEQTLKGWNFGLDSDSQLGFAELIRAAGPANERVHLCATGNEATALAMRAARAYSGKDVIGVFDGAYHGSHDYALITADPGNSAAKAHLGLGIPERLNDLVEPLTYGSSDAFQRIRNLRSELAAVMVEPVQSSSPKSETESWLRELEQVCRDCGVLIILDEGLTGFRLAYGGAQERYALQPDIVTYGKAMAGGLPMGAIAGREDVMQVFSPGILRPSVFAGSTFAGNPLSIAAGTATLTYLLEHRSALYEDLDQRAADLATGLNEFWTDKKAPIHMLQHSSLLKVVFQPAPMINSTASSVTPPQGQDAFFVHLLDRGVALHASGNIYLSAAHEREDIEYVANAFMHATQQTMADGLLTSGH